ncbi:uncharacterized protein LOC126552869 [Aphis gossypii]|uniref:uncharacterized protein LOC126552869 n=1 Tax=Aphis gossypii TaxID=80765 RepID=UPI002158CEC0|nr:uncharacterized protein LOC126552869 [Aphis gossypii]
MSNNSTPSFGGYEYRRILEEIPVEDDAQIMIEHDENGYEAITASEDSGYSTHRESQIGIWYRAFSPIHSPATPLLPRPSQDPFRSLSPIPSEPSSPDMFAETTPRPIVLRVRNDLFPDGSDDGYDIQLIELMNAYENNWGEDGNDEEMNRHMDAYEGSKKQL